MGKTSTEHSMTKANYLHLKKLLTGKYLQASVNAEKRKALEQETGYGNVDSTVKKLEAMGIVQGYAPILTEKGRKLMDALATIYEEDTELTGMLEKMG